MILLRIILCSIITLIMLTLFSIIYIKIITKCGDIIMELLEEHDKNK